MKKLYRIPLLLIAFIFLSTYNPNKFGSTLEEKYTFFEIKNIKIVNNFLIKKNEIKEKLSKIYNKNIFLVKRNDIEKSLKKVNFLEKIEVKKKYPDTIIIKIFETKPVANLLKNKVKYILDSSSNLILFENNLNFNKLPYIFGVDAENNFVNFLNQLNNNSFPNKEIINFYYFQVGRWDIQLINNKIIKFPHNNVEDAIKKSTKLLKHKDFENYNIIDLRIDGKIIVE